VNTKTLGFLKEESRGQQKDPRGRKQDFWELEAEAVGGWGGGPKTRFWGLKKRGSGSNTRPEGVENKIRRVKRKSSGVG
jgi:hypothetical protein